MIRGADLVVVCDAPYGPGNLPNLRMALEAARAGTPTVLFERMPMAERDFTGGRATDLWNAIREICEVVDRYDQVVVG